MKNNNKVALLALLTLFLSACGGGDDGDTTPPASTPAPAPQPVNNAPNITLKNITVKEREAATITADATDSDGSIASYSWVKKSGPEVVTQGNATGTLSFTAPEVSEDQILVFTLTVTDDKGASTSRDVQVSVVNNLLPEISVAGVTLREGRGGTISAEVSDPDGSVSGFDWVQKSGTPAMYSGENTGVLTITAPVVSADEILVFTLTATDNDGESSSRDVQVNVVNNRLPEISVADLALRERGSASINAVVKDPDGSVSNIAWVQKSGTPAMYSGENTGVLAITAPVVSSDEILVFTLTATDNDGESSSRDVQVNVVNNLLPDIVVSDIVVNEGDSAVITADVSDSDGSVESFEWIQKSGTQAIFTGEDTDSLNLTAPIIAEDEVLVFSLRATDNDGETTARDVNVSVKANVLVITLQGKVWDSPVADAKLTVEVAEQRFYTVADSEGNYSIDVQVDDSLANELVKIIAVGPEDDSITRLISLADDFESLLELAGNDNILTRDESFAVNVTNVSTAIYSLMKYANNNEEIATKESFDTALENYDASFVLPLATAIKLVLDYSDDNPELGLPNGVANVAVFAENLASVNNYIENARDLPSSLYSEVEQIIVSNPEVIDRNTQGYQVSGSYFFHPQDNDIDYNRMFLNEGGAGHYYGYSNSALTWTVTEEGTLVTFAGDGLLVSSSSIQHPSTGETVFVETYRPSILIRWFHNDAKSAQMVIETNDVNTYSAPDLPDETSMAYFFSQSATKDDGMLSMQEVIQAGANYTVNVTPRTLSIDDEVQGKYDPIRSAETTLDLYIGENDSATLSYMHYDGSGEHQEISVAATFNIDSTGTLNVEPENNLIQNLNVAIDKQTPATAYVTDPNVYRLDGGYLFKKNMSGWTNEMAPGIYAIPWDFREPLYNFWIEIYANGEALTVSTWDNNEDGVLSNDEFLVMPSLWMINESGKMVVRRYRGAGYEYCEPLQWETTLADECRLYNERIWELYDVVDDEYHINQIHEFYYDPFLLEDELQDFPADKHILWNVSDNNVYRIKVESRPIPIPD
ncbi:hypothetical protein L2750_22460 [Shewanella submarina]|uniref:Ig-like domain-containing protein n=1 Tax=Shewanella submarina TaxID=2016376 RepID=A0ABV7GCY7_9GAMM|nr:putative Ig domain-containing protein [Shewanella submarina]MCL1039870.1 hypothetical protein [Shewanella submarina]